MSFAEFSYNNNYQASIGMSPFEALYGQSCRTPLNWSEPGERPHFGPDIVMEAEEKVKIIVGTSGLGYPLLLCLGKSLVVILDYALTA